VTHLVTGGLGFIGSHLVDRLIAQGEQVMIVDDNRGGSTYQPPDGVEVIDSAVSPLVFMMLPEFSTIWHLASPVGPVGVLEQAGQITTEIIGDLDTISEIAGGAPIIYVSTSEVYGGGEGGLCREDMAMHVSADVSARLEYQTAKLAGEVMMLNRWQDVRVIRPFNVAGPRQRPEGGFVLARWVEQWQRGKPITVYQPGTQKRAMTHVLDIIDGMMQVRAHGERGVYNIGNPDNVVSMRELADLFCSITGATSVEVDPVDLHGPEFREAADKFPDASKTMALGWSPRRSVADIIWDLTT
jgi:nucleoside-diphosphate-sugar epimerase